MFYFVFNIEIRNQTLTLIKDLLISDFIHDLLISDFIIWI